MIPALVTATIAAVAGLVAIERLDTVWRVWVKALASTGFVAIALAAGALGTGYGIAVLTGLGLAWIGDLLLALPARRAFRGGLVAFLLGHVAYVAAFSLRGLAWLPGAAVGAGAAVVGVLVWRWLRPHLDREMSGPVAAYVVVISLMVIGAAATAGHDLDVRIVAGAGLFYLSDLFVARQRFVAPGYANRLLGLPLYYAGQVLLALSVG